MAWASSIIRGLEILAKAQGIHVNGFAVGWSQGGLVVQGNPPDESQWSSDLEDLGWVYVDDEAAWLFAP